MITTKSERKPLITIWLTDQIMREKIACRGNYSSCAKVIIDLSRIFKHGNSQVIGSFVIRLTIVTLFLITPFRPLTAGLYRAMVSIYWAGLLVIAWLTSSSTTHQHARELYCSSSHVGHAYVNIKYNLIKLSFRS